jgi:hypothetical protein
VTVQFVPVLLTAQVLLKLLSMSSTEVKDQADLILQNVSLKSKEMTTDQAVLIDQVTLEVNTMIRKSLMISMSKC